MRMRKRPAGRRGSHDGRTPAGGDAYPLPCHAATCGGEAANVRPHLAADRSGGKTCERRAYTGRVYARIHAGVHHFPQVVLCMLHLHPGGGAACQVGIMSDSDAEYGDESFESSASIAANAAQQAAGMLYSPPPRTCVTLPTPWRVAFFHPRAPPRVNLDALALP
ncbi:hypothetical protein EON67_07780, partial [archaeon]